MDLQELPLFPEADPTRRAMLQPVLTLPDDPFIVVSLSGGKDSVAALLLALEHFGASRVMAHHQVILEDWPGTPAYCQAVCDFLGVQLVCSQAHYYGYVCTSCGNRSLSSQEKAFCPKCAGDAELVMQVTSVLDLVEWRKMWPSSRVRFCTSYLKRDVWNAWARRNKTLLGPSPVLVLGERWAESPNRSRLPALRPRSQMEWIREWRPALPLRRIDAFRASQAYGIEPHPCYKLQGMTDREMYEVDREGGPRMSCVMCFYKPAHELYASAQIESAQPIFTRAVALEQATGHTHKVGQSLTQVILPRMAHDTIQPLLLEQEDT